MHIILVGMAFLVLEILLLFVFCYDMSEYLSCVCGSLHCVLFNHAACSNPLHSLPVVQIIFFFTFLETPPLAHAQ